MNTKRMFLILCALFLLAALCACGKSGSEEGLGMPVWYCGLEVTEKTSLTSVEISEVQEYTLELSVTDQRGDILEGKWTGVYLKDALEFSGLSDYTLVTLTAEDGTTKELKPKTMEEEGVFIAVKLNGEYVWSGNDDKEGGGKHSPWTISTREAPEVLTEELDKISVNRFKPSEERKGLFDIFRGWREDA